jgi:hypothetical protein
MRQLYFLVLLLMMFSCKQVTNTTNTVRDTAHSNENLAVTNEKPLDSEAFREFTLIRGGIKLRLRDWKRTIDLEKLGVPTDTSSTILGEGADTHRGSVVNDYKFKGIRIYFFGPPGGKDLWLLSMEVTGTDWKTAREIRVGDDLNRLQERYPEATNQFSGDKRIYRFTEFEAVIEFVLKEEKISMIRVRYEIP